MDKFGEIAYKLYHRTIKAHHGDTSHRIEYGDLSPRKQNAWSLFAAEIAVRAIAEYQQAAKSHKKAKR